MLRLYRPPHITIALAVVVFATVTLTTTLRSAPLVLMSDAPARASRSQSDTGGQTASPNPSGGFDQEERVRQALAKQYEQRFGTSDEAIRSSLGIRGKVADFVGFNAERNQWLIAESKASNISDAVVQLENTAKGLLTKYPGANIELRLYLDGEHFAHLASGNRVYGWMVNAEQYLGFPNELDQFTYEFVRGIRILVFEAPAP